MDRDQFEKELSALKDGHLTDIDIVEESKGKTGADGGTVRRDGDDEKDVYKSTLKIYDLPLELLWEVMKMLDGDGLCSLAGAHQNLLYATKHLRNKKFWRVECVSTVRPDSPRNAQTPDVLGILLHGANAGTLYLNSDVLVFAVEGLTLGMLFLKGDEPSTDYAAIVVEKLKPTEVYLQLYKTSIWTPRLGQALSTIREIFPGDVGMEMLDFITQWNFICFGGRLKNPEDGEMPPRFFDVIRQLLDQYTSGERTRCHLSIRFKSVLRDDQLHSNVFGPDYPLQPLDSCYGFFSPSFALNIHESRLTINSRH